MISYCRTDRDPPPVLPRLRTPTEPPILRYENKIDLDVTLTATSADVCPPAPRGVPALCPVPPGGCCCVLYSRDAPPPLGNLLAMEVPALMETSVVPTDSIGGSCARVWDMTLFLSLHQDFLWGLGQRSVSSADVGGDVYTCFTRASAGPRHKGVPVCRTLNIALAFRLAFVRQIAQVRGGDAGINHCRTPGDGFGLSRVKSRDHCEPGD
ncbi:hypothetical protein Bbelb_307800 [Branchiostoma belcheri]|nr:hypothetical protein Bbelb_307800 [Branchiostoma belcheri]